MAVEATDIHRDEDVEILRKSARGSLGDRRVVNYFSRGHVGEEDVFRAIDQDSIYEECRRVKIYERYIKARTKVDRIHASIREAKRPGVLNWKIVTVTATFLSIMLLAFGGVDARGTRLHDADFQVDGHFVAHNFTILILVTAGAVVVTSYFSGLFVRRRRRRNRVTAYCLLILPCALAATVIFSLDFTVFSCRPAWLYSNLVCEILAGYLLSEEETARNFRTLRTALAAASRIDEANKECAKLKQGWIEYSLEKFIHPKVVLAINEILGEDSTKLLVEQDSEGLRRLQDPAFTISTRSEHQLRNLVARMDGGSIAVTGSRGAGKTTLLRRMCDYPEYYGRLNVYTSAPAVYVAREFLAELFQQICHEYLQRYDRAIAEVRYRGLRTDRDEFHVARRVATVMALFWGLLAGVFLVALLRPAYTRFQMPTPIIRVPIASWTNELVEYASRDRRTVVLVLFVISAGILLRQLCLLTRKIPEKPRVTREQSRIIRRAQNYSAHLKIERTASWSANLGIPGIRGASVSLGKGVSDKYVPWSMPELVGKFRGFLGDISESDAEPIDAIVIGIDEIDRIGSVDQAERFIGEVKSIFGIPNCFFLVSVAEDIGSLFPRQLITGRSALENAFDDVIVVDALEFSEARELLSARVPGFTDSFVFLALALSGGLPREMIRVARRLVELNHREEGNDSFPRVGDLAFRLVVENVAEVLRVSRNQLARLSLPDSWGDVFCELRNAMAILREEGIPGEKRRRVIRDLCSVRIPEPTGQPGAVERNRASEESAANTVIGLTAFSCYSITVIEAFDNDCFDLSEVRENVRDTSGKSYAELAAARLELGISPDSSRSILRRFRARVGLPPLP